MPKSTPRAKNQKTQKISRIAPFTIAAEKKERLQEIARANHRELTPHLRWLIDQHLAETEKDAA